MPSADAPPKISRMYRLGVARPLCVSLAVLAPLLMGATGCAKASDADCEKLADKIVELGKKEAVKVSDVGEAAADAMRPQMLEECLQHRPTPKEMQCLLAAESKEDIEGC